MIVWFDGLGGLVLVAPGVAQLQIELGSFRAPLADSRFKLRGATLQIAFPLTWATAVYSALSRSGDSGFG